MNFRKNERGETGKEPQFLFQTETGGKLQHHLQLLNGDITVGENDLSDPAESKKFSNQSYSSQFKVDHSNPSYLSSQRQNCAQQQSFCCAGIGEAGIQTVDCCVICRRFVELREGIAAQFLCDLPKV